MSRETGEILVKLLGKAIDGPAALSHAIAVATLIVVEYLLGCVDCGMASDIHDIKDSLLRKTMAESKAAAADAQKRLAEAAEAANRATLHKRNDAIARAQRAQLKAEAAKTQAEADAIRSDAETRRLQADAEVQARLMEAKSRLIEAVSKLRQEGGDVFFDGEALHKMLNGDRLVSLDAEGYRLKNLLAKGLTRAERLIVVLYYYERCTPKEIGAILDLSESRVSQVYSSIVARLKAELGGRFKDSDLVIRELEKKRSSMAVRKDKVLQLRQQITEGTYDLTDRLDTVVARVLADLTA